MSGYLVKRAQSVIHLALEEIVSNHGLGILNAHLTHAGEKKWRSVHDGVQKLEERLLQGLTRDEVRILNRSLETMIENMTERA